MNSKKDKYDPIDLIKKWWPDADISHITYDKDMKIGGGDYLRIEQSGGDGTLSHTIQMIQKSLLPILNKESFTRNNEPSDWSKVKDIKYVIGPISHATVFGMVNLRCGGSFSGQRERVRYPVKCDYEFY